MIAITDVVHDNECQKWKALTNGVSVSQVKGDL